VSSGRSNGTARNITPTARSDLNPSASLAPVCDVASPTWRGVPARC